MENIPKKDFFSLKELNSVWRSVLHLGTKKSIPKNEKLEMRNPFNNSLIFLDQGTISLRSLNPQGRERISLYFESGCILGEPPILANTAPTNRLPFYQTHSECIVYLFPSSFVTDVDLIQKYPELAQSLLQSSATKIRYLHALVADKNGESSKEVICRYINRLANKNHANVFNPQMTQSEFALRVGIHRTSVWRTISELRKEGILGEFNKNTLEILDRERLQEIAFASV